MIAGWRVAQPFGFELGEHPVWDDRTNTLWCVDVHGGAIVALEGGASGRPKSVRRHRLGRTVGALALRDDGGIVALVDDMITFVSRRGIADNEPIVVPMPDGVRFNDAACDPAGRLLFGTAALDGVSPIAELRMLDRTGTISPCLDGLVESNGLGWSVDGDTLFFVDSAEHAIRRYDYDVNAGRVGQRRADLASVEFGAGVPDGIAIDAAGTLWVAIWEGGRVHRYAPDGELLEVISTPTSRPTCPGFGGPALGTLFLASGWEGLDTEGRAREPHSGDLFVRHAAVPGRSVARLRSPAAARKRGRVRPTA